MLKFLTIFSLSVFTYSHAAPATTDAPIDKLDDEDRASIKEFLEAKSASLKEDDAELKKEIDEMKNEELKGYWKQLIIHFHKLGDIVSTKKDFDLVDILPEMQKLVDLYAGLSETALAELSKDEETAKYLKESFGEKGTFAKYISGEE